MHGGSVRPRRWALTKAAQAPEPQARVKPAPRSQTRSRIVAASSTWAKPILARCGNSLSCSSAGPIRRDRHDIQIVNEEGGVRIAHADGCWFGDAIGRQVKSDGVHRARQGNVAPVEPGRSHVDLNLPIGTEQSQQVARNRANGDRSLSRLADQELGDTSRGVAACFRLRTIGVANAHERVRPRRRRSERRRPGRSRFRCADRRWRLPAPRSGLGAASARPG